MKIQNITLAKTFSPTKNLSARPKNNLISKDMPYDSISFSANVPSDKAHLEREADTMRQISLDILNEAQEVKEDANNLFMESFKAYQDALSLIKQAKNQIAQGGMTLENGNFAAISFQVKDNEVEFCIEEFDEDDNTVREIAASSDLKPKRIIDFSLEKPRRYTFSNDTVEIMDEIDLESQNVGKLYRYSKEGLKKAMIYIELSDENPIYGEDYIFLGGKLIKYLRGVSKNEDSTFCDERYTFVDENLKTYYENFYIGDEGYTTWEKSFHYDKERLLARIQNASKKPDEDVIRAKNATYISDCGEWEEKINSCCLLSDYGDVIIL